MTPFKVFAHRGASAYTTDNEAEAFELAIRQGAPVIETDVQMTADGILVLQHDALVEGRFVAAVTLAELQQIRPGLLTVAAALRDFGERIPFCWEIKASGFEAALVALVRDSVPADIWQQTEFTSFYPASAYACQQHAPRNRAGWLTREYNESAIEACHAAGLSQYCPPAPAIIEQPALVKVAQEKGLLVRAWHVDDPAWVPQLAAAGVYGATVNWPDQALAALESES